MNKFFDLFFVNYSYAENKPFTGLEKFINYTKQVSDINDDNITTHLLYGTSLKEIGNIIQKREKEAGEENFFAVTVFFESNKKPACSDICGFKDQHAAPNKLFFYACSEDTDDITFDNSEDIRFQILLALRYFFNEEFMLEVRESFISCNNIKLLDPAKVPLIATCSQVKRTADFTAELKENFINNLNRTPIQITNKVGCRKNLDSANNIKTRCLRKNQILSSLVSLHFRIFVEKRKEQPFFPTDEFFRLFQKEKYSDCFILILGKYNDLKKNLNTNSEQALTHLVLLAKMLLDLNVLNSVSSIFKTDDELFAEIEEIVFKNHICFDLACECILHNIQQNKTTSCNALINEVCNYTQWKNSEFLFPPMYYFCTLAEAACSKNMVDCLASCANTAIKLSLNDKILPCNPENLGYLSNFLIKAYGEVGDFSKFEVPWDLIDNLYLHFDETQPDEFNIYSADSLYTYGVYSYENGETEQAVESFAFADMIYSTNLSDDSGKSLIGKLKTSAGLMKCYLRMNRLDDASKLFIRAVKLSQRYAPIEYADYKLCMAELCLLMSEVWAKRLNDKKARQNLHIIIDILKPLLECVPVSGGAALLYSKAIVGLYNLEEYAFAEHYIAQLVSLMPAKMQAILDKLDGENNDLIASEFNKETFPLSLQMAYCNAFSVSALINEASSGMNDLTIEEQARRERQGEFLLNSISRFLDDDDNTYNFISVLDTYELGCRFYYKKALRLKLGEDFTSLENLYSVFAATELANFMPRYAEVHFTIANAYNKSHMYDKESKYLYNALSIFDSLAKNDEQRYNLYVARTFYKMAKSFLLQDIMPRAEFCYKAATELFTPYIQKEPCLINVEIAECLIDCANSLSLSPEEILEKYLSPAQQLLEDFNEVRPVTTKLGLCHYWIAHYLHTAGKFHEMEKYALSAIDLLTSCSDATHNFVVARICILFNFLGNYFKESGQKKKLDIIIDHLYKLIEKYPHERLYEETLMFVAPD